MQAQTDFYLLAYLQQRKINSKLLGIGFAAISIINASRFLITVADVMMPLISM